MANRRAFAHMVAVAMVALLLVAALPEQQVPGLRAAGASADNPNPPGQPVRLIFIHHSVGGHWLGDPNQENPYGGLGAALMNNNYYVSATNYGWGPGAVGDRTDIVNWPEWFTGPNSTNILNQLYNESGQNVDDFGAWPRLATNPGGQNQIILFKSCYPNSDLYGHPSDPPLAQPNEDDFTVANAKAAYNKILTYFATRQDKLFVLITSPPMMQGEYTPDDQTPAERAANARALANWLVNDWLDGYAHNNVAVFDYYNVLTSNGSPSRVDDPESNEEPNDAGWTDGNHHRWRNGAVQHVKTVNNDYSAYPSGDSHPSIEGQQKATAEFVQMLNVFYNRWKGTVTPPTATSPAFTPTRTRTPTRTPPGWTGVHIYLPVILRRWAAPVPTPTRTPTARPATPTATSLPVPGLLQPSNLTYVGAFRLPDDADDDIGWLWSGQALTYYPGGDSHGPADGYPGSLFGIGNNTNQWVSEISIPVPVNSPSKNLDALNTATTLQPFADIRGGLFPELEQARVGLEYLPAQGSQTSGKLYFAWAHHQDEGATSPTHGWCDLTLANPHTVGTWRVGEWWNYRTGDYLFAIPTDWAAAYTGGRSLATGRYREGGQGTLGPALVAIAPWQHGNPPAPGTTLATTTLLMYGTVYDEDAPRINGYTHCDEWMSGGWLTAGNRSAVVFIGTKAVASCWYGCSDGTVWPDEPPFPPACEDRGFWSNDFTALIIFYRTTDLAAVAQGTTDSWAPQPYATMNLTSYLYPMSPGAHRTLISSAAFDRQRGLLYVMQPHTDGDRPIVHVFRVTG